MWVNVREEAKHYTIFQSQFAFLSKIYRLYESAKGDRLENEDEVNERQRCAEDDAAAQPSGQEVGNEQREREQVRDSVRG